MPVMVEPVLRPLSALQRDELARVYIDSPEFTGPEAALVVLDADLAEGDSLYCAIFNARYIGAIMVRGEGDIRYMRYLCVHEATRGRGVAERLLAEVRRLEAARGTRWLEAEFDLSQAGVPEMLLALGFIPHGQGNYRCLVGAAVS